MCTNISLIVLEEFFLLIIDGGEIDRLINFFEGHRQLITLILRLIFLRRRIACQ